MSVKRMEAMVKRFAHQGGIENFINADEARQLVKEARRDGRVSRGELALLTELETKTKPWGEHGQHKPIGRPLNDIALSAGAGEVVSEVTGSADVPRTSLTPQRRLTAAQVTTLRNAIRAAAADEKSAWAKLKKAAKIADNIKSTPEERAIANYQRQLYADMVHEAHRKGSALKEELRRGLIGD